MNTDSQIVQFDVNKKKVKFKFWIRSRSREAVVVYFLGNKTECRGFKSRLAPLSFFIFMCEITFLEHNCERTHPEKNLHKPAK